MNMDSVIEKCPSLWTVDKNFKVIGVLKHAKPFSRDSSHILKSC